MAPPLAVAPTTDKADPARRSRDMSPAQQAHRGNTTASPPSAPPAHFPAGTSAASTRRSFLYPLRLPSIGLSLGSALAARTLARAYLAAAWARHGDRRLVVSHGGIV